MFVLDGSVSVSHNGESEWSNMLEFAARVVDRINPGPSGARVGFIQYSTDAVNEFFLETYDRESDILNRIRSLEQLGGRTNTERALVVLRREQFVLDRGDRRDVPNVAIVITDGGTNFNDPNDVIAVAREANNAGIVTRSVGVTTTAREKVEEISHIGSPPHKENEDYFMSETFEGLFNHVTNVVENICNIGQSGTLGPTPTTTPSGQIVEGGKS